MSFKLIKAFNYTEAEIRRMNYCVSKKNSQQMWDYDNHLQKQCQDHEIIYVQVYHIAHRISLDPP